jgi:hypothetical protein
MNNNFHVQRQYVPTFRYSQKKLEEGTKTVVSTTSDISKRVHRKQMGKQTHLIHLLKIGGRVLTICSSICSEIKHYQYTVSKLEKLFFCIVDDNSYYYMTSDNVFF